MPITSDLPNAAALDRASNDANQSAGNLSSSIWDAIIQDAKARTDSNKPAVSAPAESIKAPVDIKDSYDPQGRRDNEQQKRLTGTEELKQSEDNRKEYLKESIKEAQTKLAPVQPPEFELSPAKYEIKAGDSYESIARAKLKTSDEAQIKKYADEIRFANAVAGPGGVFLGVIEGTEPTEGKRVFKAGDSIILPGVTKDGDRATLDHEGNLFISFKDGKTRTIRPDGTGKDTTYGASGMTEDRTFGPKPSDNKLTIHFPDGTVKELRSDGSGTITKKDEHNIEVSGWGTKPEDNFTRHTKLSGVLHNHISKDGVEKDQYTWPKVSQSFEVTKTADGTKEFSEPSKAPYKWMADPAVERSRKELLAQADKAMTDPQTRDKFEMDMHRLESRANTLADRFTKQGLSEEEATKKANEQISQSYDQLTKLLTANTDSTTHITKDQRAQLAQELMSQAARPTDIDQGKHPTCSVAAIEVRTFERLPAKAIELVTSIATTGEYKTATGKTVKLDTTSLEPHDSAKNYPPFENERSFASQLFETTAINISRQSKSPHNSYSQTEPTENDKAEGGRSLVAKNIDVNLGIAHFQFPMVESESATPGLTDADMVNVGNQITGETNRNWIIHEGNFGSARDLKNRLNEAQSKGEMPLVALVDVRNRPLSKDSLNTNGETGSHALTVHDISDGPKPTIGVDNQWGNNHDRLADDRRLTPEELFLSMKEKGSYLNSLKINEKKRGEGRPDYVSELIDIDRAATFEELTVDERKNKTIALIDEIAARFKVQKTQPTEKVDEEGRRIPIPPDDSVTDLRNTTTQAMINWGIDQVRDKLPPEERLPLLELQHAKGLLSDDEAAIRARRILADTKGSRSSDVTDTARTNVEKQYDEFFKRLPERLQADKNKTGQGIIRRTAPFPK